VVAEEPMVSRGPGLVSSEVAGVAGGVQSALVQAELERILASQCFSRTHRLDRFLRFTVERAIQGRAHEVKEYLIGFEVFDRKVSYDPRLDPIVRVEAGRLRELLKRYYETEGRSSPIRIELPKGSYVPVFHTAAASSAPAHAGRFRMPAAPPFLALTVAALILATAVATYLVTRATMANTALDANPTAIAVLPFADLSSENDQEYFSAGLTEELISALARVPGLRVLSRNSTSRFAGPNADVRKIGRELHASTVLEGSVRKAGDRLRITVRLSDASEGYTLWAETYERSIQDVFAVQEEISQAIVRSLRGRLPVSPSRPLVRPNTASVEAYNSYLRGRYHWNRRNEEALHKAITYFTQALADDPQYAAAYSGLADSYAVLAHQGSQPSTEVLPKAKEAALKALEIDQTLAEAHSSLAYVQMYYDWNLAEAERSLQRALQIDPQYLSAHQWLGVLRLLRGRFDEALLHLQRAEELDPLSPNVKRAVADVHYRRQDHERAIEKCREALDLDPNFASAYVVLGRSYQEQGRFAEALASFQQAREISPRKAQLTAMMAHTYARWGKEREARQLLGELQNEARKTYVPSFYLALVYTGLGQKNDAVQALEQALEERSVWIVGLGVDPRFEPLRGLPRFTALLRKLPSAGSG
jgi:TolB-like protein/Flp pilus assembly protein TadD